MRSKVITQGDKKQASDIKRRVKQPSKKTIKAKAWYAFSRFIRLRDCLFTTGTPDRGKCITCSFEFPFELLQAGHFIAGRHNANLFSEKGVHAQCRSCNIYGHGKPLEYRKAIIDIYGDGYDEVLEKEAQEIKKYTIEDYKEIEEYYKKEYQKLLDNYNKVV
jgi:hypothetical protein